MAQPRPPHLSPSSRAYTSALRALQAGQAGVLPSLNALAGEAGVCRVTMWKALRRLEREGLVRAFARRGYIATGATPPAHTASARQAPLSADTPRDTKGTRLSDVTGRIAASIRQGTLPAGSALPPLKHLRGVYRTSYATLISALRGLVTSGLVERDRRGYRVYATAPPGGRPTLAVIAFERHAGVLASITPRGLRLWSALEDECRRLGLRMVLRDIHQVLGEHVDSAPQPNRLARFNRDSGALGYLVLGLGLWQNAYDHLLPALQRLECSAAFLLETGDIEPQMVSGRATRIGHYSCAITSSCGHQVAQYLFGLGHRRIAFFTTVSGDRLLYRRYEGLVGFFAQAGLPDAVSLFGFTGLRSYAELSEDQGRSEVALACNDFETQLSVLLRRTLCDIPPSIHGQLSALYSRLGSIKRYTYVYDHSLNAFARAAADRSITAWVCADDPTALLALDWCHANGVSVPAQVSVMGFDDSAEALGAGLTSYNFNQAGIVQAMIAQVVERRTSSPASVEIPGFVTERSTCGRAPVRKTESMRPAPVRSTE